MSHSSPSTRQADPLAVLGEALERLPRAGAVAVCHVLEVRGSTPCKPGWKKLITADGEAFGNLGGGSFEAQVLGDARALLDGSRRGRCERYYFTERASRGEATGMSCGGFAEVWIEIMTTKPVMIVCGGGPVGEALAANAAVCDFDVVVVDDRQEFADSGLHPAASTRRVATDYSDLALDEYAGRDLYVCVVSRSWKTDSAALARVLAERPPRLRYLGLMGSRRKIDKVRSKLPGHLAEDWDRVEAPIGFDIDAETPAEIAVSILAQVIAVRRQDSESESVSPSSA